MFLLSTATQTSTERLCSRIHRTQHTPFIMCSLFVSDVHMQYVQLNLPLIESLNMGCVAEVLITSLAPKTRPDSSDVVRCRQKRFYDVIYPIFLS